MANGSKRVHSPWDGYDPHPVITAIDYRLQKLDFKLVSGGASDGWFYHWTRDFFETAKQFIDINPHTSHTGMVNFSATLGLSSFYYMDVENELKTWKCGGTLLEPDEPLQIAPYLMQIELHWLLLNANPPLKRISWSTTVSSVEESADLLLQDLNTYGIPFFEQVSTPDKLISFLKDIENYPKKTPAPGPRAAEASLCAALLLHYFGNSEAALLELETGFREDMARYGRTWPNPNDYEKAIKPRQCKIEKYRRFFMRELANDLQPEHVRPLSKY